MFNAILFISLALSVWYFGLADTAHGLVVLSFFVFVAHARAKDAAN